VQHEKEQNKSSYCKIYLKDHYIYSNYKRSSVAVIEGSKNEESRAILNILLLLI